jgi:DNA-binding HxlR family transcriptional regulator
LSGIWSASCHASTRDPPSGHLIDVRTESFQLEGVQAAVGALSPKWSVAVLAQLAEGTARFGELTHRIGVSRRMLSATLRSLEADGIVERRVYADVPVRVEYDLSPSGEELYAALAPLAGWALQHRIR